MTGTAMRIGIDVSQVVYEGTGVGRYVERLVLAVLAAAPEQMSFVLFGAAWGKRVELGAFMERAKAVRPSIRIVTVPLPPAALDVLWNRLHIVPVTWLTGAVDVFWSSDWTQPPLGGATGLTTIHDVSFLRFPESFDERIPAVHQRRLARAKRDCRRFLCDSAATKHDLVELMGFDPATLTVVYPGN